MTSDAKVGLLLGLVFIFIIAFVINGLPRFRSAANNSELTTNMVSSQNDTLGIGAMERKAREDINRAEQIREQPYEEIQPPAENDESVRFEMQLPRNTPTVKDAPIVETTYQVGPIAPTSIISADINANEKTEVKEPEPVKSTKPAAPKAYVVREGDTLADIAKEIYGALEGNKRINIMWLFEANRKLLRSADEIRVGQELVIPPLPASAQSKDRISSVFSSTLFEEVKSIGRKRPSADERKEQSGQYVVREGDSLWRIAAEQLGDGSRYKEIGELNVDILEDEDSLALGMRLRMPAR